MKEKLLASMINNRKRYPERMNTTFERIEEVLDVLGTTDLIKECQEAGGITDKRQELTQEQAEKIIEVLVVSLPPNKLRRLAKLILDGELSTAEAIDLHEQFKIPVSRLEKDLIFVRGEGAWVIDINGRRFLDMDSNYSANNLGMANPEIALGLFNQAKQLISTKEDRVHIPRTRFLKVIHKMMPEGLTQFYWQNSGGEAVDKSLKIAKAYTGQRGVIAFEGSFHGRTHGAVSVTYNLKYRQPFLLDKEDWVHFVPYNDASAVEEILKAGKARIIIMELVQGEEAGNRPAQPDFVRRLRELCDQYKAVLICDEVQTGFGRTATQKGQWWASQVYGITPDIMVIGKSFGGGYPVTAVVTKSEISKAMKPGYDGSTFGGNPMAMVAAFIATRQMQEKDITSNVVARSQQFVDGLKKINSSLVGKIMTLGLMIGFDLPDREAVQDFQEELKQYKIHSSLSSDNTVRFLPPLIISENEMDFLLKGTSKVLKKMGQRASARIKAASS